MHLVLILQQEVILLTETDCIPLMLLELMLWKTCSHLEGAPLEINEDLRKIGKRNMWHGIFPESFNL